MESLFYLAVDPGELTGWARFLNGVPQEFGELNIEDFYRWLHDEEQPSYDYIVLEDYLIRPPQSGGFNHEWGRVPTIQVIGAVKCFATLYGIPVELQQSSILTPGAAQFNLPHPKKKSLPNRNAISAVIHGHWFWKMKGAKLHVNDAQKGS